MNVVNKLITIAIVVWLFTGIGCKEPVEQPVEDNISGVYKVYAKVTKRPKIFEPEYAPSWAIQMHGVWIDTTENICCGDRVGKIKNCCPDEYVMDNFEIYLHDGIYFIRNKTTYDADSNRLTWDIPLVKTKDKLELQVIKYFKRDAYIGDYDYHPSSFKLLDFELNTGNFEGSWTIHDYTCSSFAYSCFNTLDNNTYRYGMGELADLRFEKVE
jgi:hypothetical protein